MAQFLGEAVRAACRGALRGSAAGRFSLSQQGSSALRHISRSPASARPSAARRRRRSTARNSPRAMPRLTMATVAACAGSTTSCDVEARDFGKIARLRDDQLGNAARCAWRRCAPTSRTASCAAARSVLPSNWSILPRISAIGDTSAFAHHRLEQFFLVGEVQVERALGDAGARGDVLQARAGVAALDEQLQRGGGDFFRARLLAARPAGLGFGGERVMGKLEITDQSVI